MEKIRGGEKYQPAVFVRRLAQAGTFGAGIQMSHAATLGCKFRNCWLMGLRLTLSFCHQDDFI